MAGIKTITEMTNLEEEPVDSIGGRMQEKIKYTLLSMHFRGDCFELRLVSHDSLSHVSNIY